MNGVADVVNIIRGKTEYTRHSKFAEHLHDLDTEYEDVPL